MKIIYLSLIIYFFTCFGVKAASLSTDTTTIKQLNKVAEENARYNSNEAYNYAIKSIEQSRKVHYDSGLATGLLIAARINVSKGDSISASSKLNEAILLFQKLKNKKGLAQCYLSYGSMNNTIGNYKLALSYLNKALPIFIEAKDQITIADCYKQIGVISYSQGNLSNALDYYYKALFMAVNTHNTILVAEIYNDIGVILQNLQVYSTALEYFQKSAAIFEKSKNLEALGIVYENIAEIMLAESDLNNASIYLHKAYVIDKKENNPDGLSAVYANTGLYYYYKGQKENAINSIDTALSISVKNKMVYDEAYALISMAKVDNDEKLYKKAYPNALKGYQMSKKLGNIFLRINSTLQLKRTLDGLGRINEAYKKFDEYFYIKDGSENKQSVERLIAHNLQLNFNYDKILLEQKQKEKTLRAVQSIRLQKYTNTVYIVIISALVIIIALFYVNQRKQRKMTTLLKENNSLIIHQKNDLDDLNKMKNRLIGVMAHDLRAPLSTLTGLFNLLEDRSIDHEELLTMIPKVLSNLKYTSDFLDTLLYWINSQMENFQNAASPFFIKQAVLNEKNLLDDLLQKKDLQLNIDIQQDMKGFADSDSIRVVVRNLLTNAIKFSNYGSNIDVSCTEKDHKLILSIRDYGIGMTQERSKSIFTGRVSSSSGTFNESGTGMGLMFCRDLIENNKGEIWVDSRLGEGTVFSFSIPISAV